MVLFLGDLIFEDFELPEKLPHGGKHELKVHEIIGGRRVFDAMGPNDAPISWSGILLGETAHLRSLQLDLLRRSGRVVELRHNLRRYRGTVTNYVGAVENPTTVRYDIEFTILEDVVAGEGGSRSVSFEQQVAADLEAARAAAAARDSMIAAVNMVANIIRDPSSLKGYLRVVGGEVIGEMKGAISGAVGTFVAEGAQADLGLAAAGGLGEAVGTQVSGAVASQVGGATVGRIGTVGGVQRGGDPPVMAARLTNVATDAAVSHSAIVGGAALTRMQTNIDRAPP